MSGDLGTISEGLEPEIAFPPVAFSRKGFSLWAEDSRLNAGYATKLDADTSLSLRLNDEKEWLASLARKDASLTVRGDGSDLGSLSWDASQSSTVKGVGDVQLDFNSDKEYNLTVSRKALDKFAGAEVDGQVRATNAGFSGMLAARRHLPSLGADVTYGLENEVGVYDLRNSTHRVGLRAPFAGGVALISAEGDTSGQAYEGEYVRPVGAGLGSLKVMHRDGDIGYNVSLSRSLRDVLDADAITQVGIDQLGAYGRVAAQGSLTEGVKAEYEASARIGLGDEAAAPELAHSLSLSSALGQAQLLQNSRNPGAPRLRLGYEFEA